jgi:phosphoribosyl 1,2-cyclic phosphodiesterase
MAVTMERLLSRVDAGLRLAFTHLNHSNPAVDPDSEAARACRAHGFEIAQDGDVIPLSSAGRPETNGFAE